MHECLAQVCHLSITSSLSCRETKITRLGVSKSKTDNQTDARNEEGGGDIGILYSFCPIYNAYFNVLLLSTWEGFAMQVLCYFLKRSQSEFLYQSRQQQIKFKCIAWFVYLLLGYKIHLAIQRMPMLADARDISHVLCSAQNIQLHKHFCSRCLRNYTFYVNYIWKNPHNRSWWPTWDVDARVHIYAVRALVRDRVVSPTLGHLYYTSGKAPVLILQKYDCNI